MIKKYVTNNIVGAKEAREVQKRVLDDLDEILSRSFGPAGSNTCIKKENAFARYTKDGHTILGSVQYDGVMEMSIKDDIESITRHIVKTVGDGTTSAVLLADKIFNDLIDSGIIDKYNAADISRSFERVCGIIKNLVLKKAVELNPTTVYNIAMISTNGDTYISGVLKQIYEEYGNGVFIDVSINSGEDTTIKAFDGITLNVGYMDSCFITNSTANTSVVDNPEVYFFGDPVDTKEIGVLFDSIVFNNIIRPIQNQNDPNNKDTSVVPTVIYAPKISRDIVSGMTILTQWMTKMPPENRLPISIITGFTHEEDVKNLANLCGAKIIYKYLDPKVYEAEVAAGNAPTPEKVYEFAGYAESVVSYAEKTSFVRPQNMFEEDGQTYSVAFKNIIEYTRSQYKIALEEGQDATTVSVLKRRLNSLMSNMVELYIGGLTQVDRDANRDLAEDAVLNLRSAGEYGVGLGGNLNAFVVLNELINSEEVKQLPAIDYAVLQILFNAYYDLVKQLFVKPIAAGAIASDNDENVENIMATIRDNAAMGIAYNIRTKEFSKGVQSSIMSDVIILETVTKIIGIMATCNQFLVPSAAHNIYMME